MGRQAYEVIWDPLLRVKFGPYHNQISAAWMWHRIHRVALSRENFFGAESFGCFSKGTETVVQALADALQAHPRVEVILGDRARHLRIEDGRVQAVELASGRTLRADAALSTMALGQLLPLVPDLPVAYREQLADIRYIGVVCGLFVLDRPLTRSFWVNIHDDRTPFNGIIEYTNLNTDLRARLGGRSVVYVPQYLRASDPMYTMDDGELHQLYLELFRAVEPSFQESWVQQWLVSRAPAAQAICQVGFKDLVPDHQSPVPNLFLTDSVQYYPEDRTISAAIRLGRRTAVQIVDQVGLSAPGAP